LSHFAHFRGNDKKTCSALKASYEFYHISKNKIELQAGMDVDGILRSIEERYEQYPKNTIDGLKIDFDKEWVHLRKSNTEPIIRIYSESASEEKANELAEKIIADIRNLI
jgi:phosphomannomutase